MADSRSPIRPIIAVVTALAVVVAFALGAAAAHHLPTANDPKQQVARHGDLANSPFSGNRPTAETERTLREELTFQRATQSYLWAMPLLNTMGMRDGIGSPATYNTMTLWEKRLDAKTLIATPNSDLIYGMSFVDLAQTGPLVFEAPPGLQGILLDAWQRPIPVDGGEFAGDVGLPGPDRGAGGKFLLLPPGYQGPVPAGHYVYRSATNNVFVFLRAFYKSLDDITPAVDLLKRSVLYPLGAKGTAEPMRFIDASGGSRNMLPRSDATAFEQLKYLVDTEVQGWAQPDQLGALASLGITKDKPFAPDARQRALLDDAARTAYKTSRVIGMQDRIGDRSLRVYPDRQWANPFNNLESRWPDTPVDLAFTNRTTGSTALDARVWYFTNYYSISPGMVSRTPGKGAFYLVGFNDRDGAPLDGSSHYRVTLPPNVPAALFWSLTLYDADNASGLANGQPFPSLGALDKPAQNPDGSTTLYIGPTAPAGQQRNWLATVPGRGFFSLLRLYAALEPALDGSWKPTDFEKIT